MVSETSRVALWLGIPAFLVLSYAFRCRTEILILKELPNDGFETSRVALWLGSVFWF